MCFAHITECCYVVRFLVLYLEDSSLIVDFEASNFVTASLQFLRVSTGKFLNVM